jgi:hypothetical protein
MNDVVHVIYLQFPEYDNGNAKSVLNYKSRSKIFPVLITFPALGKEVLTSRVFVHTLNTSNGGEAADRRILAERTLDPFNHSTIQQSTIYTL